jgi:Predicted nucleic acid-binding protein, contains PIN domain
VRWLLDTNVVSETIKERADPHVVAWIAKQPRSDMALSIVTLAEIREGIESSADEQKRQQLTHWLETTVVMSLGQQCLTLGTAILVDWLRLSRQLARKRITRQAPDLLLASTARVHHLILATRNVPHFANTGVTVYNPWTNETLQMEAP